MPTLETRGRLHHMADGFMDALATGDEAAAQELLAAWSDAYWAARTDLDELVAYVARLRAAGEPVTGGMLARDRRFRAVLDAALDQMIRFGAQAAGIIQANQQTAGSLALTQAQALVAAAVAADLPGIVVDLGRINPANLATSVGFLGDGTPLAKHLTRTVAPDAVREVRRTMARALTQGWSTRRIAREFTKALAIPLTRATTIARTETLRVYRETSRATYEANQHVLESWQWQCALDRRSCIACVVQHGSYHPVTETLDGHPRCRCAMIPVTKTWADLGVPGIEDTRTLLAPGEDWFRAQSVAVQRGMVGPLKFQAWRDGQITLDDMVARTYSTDWGTMRLERSLKAITEGRNANWGNLPGAF